MAYITGLNSSMLHSKVFEDPEGLINPGSKQFDVDIFCENPLVIAECTSHLVADKIEKVRKFPHIVRYLEKKYNGTSKAFFFTMGIDDAIESEAKKILKENGIKLICPL